MHKASVTSVHTEANVYWADWFMSVFVNELAPPYVWSQQGQCVQQCRRNMKGTLILWKHETLWKLSQVGNFCKNCDNCVKYSLRIEDNVENHEKMENIVKKWWTN